MVRRERHNAEDAAAREVRGQEDRDPNAAALYEEVREIGSTVTDVSGFTVLDDEPDGEKDSDGAEESIAATRVG